jgi:hypothetical protein
VGCGPSHAATYGSGAGTWFGGTPRPRIIEDTVLYAYPFGPGEFCRVRAGALPPPQRNPRSQITSLIDTVRTAGLPRDRLARHF